MMKIEFQGEEYLFGGDTLEEGGFIAKPEAYIQGKCSYAHLLTGGEVRRFGDTIGHRTEIKVLDYNCPDPSDSLSDNERIDSMLNMITHPSWLGEGK